MARPGFWDDPEAARQTIESVNELKGWVEPAEALEKQLRDLRELGALLREEEAADPAMVEEWAAEVDGLAKGLRELELRNMLRTPEAHRDALLTIHPGAGGTESQDWAQMLMRMYARWAESHDYEVRILDLQPGEEAGIKSASLEIRGPFAYGYLQAEKGIHRLVRISPFDQAGRRHTSFASVFVYPLVDDEIEIEIDEDDLRIDTFRASGKGGQHVNKTSSAVRITHEPTGIVVSCQAERSQFKNKATALKMLKAALYERALEQRRKEREKLDAGKTEISWGNQIRSYVFQPYRLVKDHRTEIEVGDVERVMDGDLDAFIEGYLRQQAAPAA
jgi:peptide chain release factor 2